MVSKGAGTRQQILGEALAAASTHGLAGLTIGSLAKTVGMSKSGLFAHFRSKEQLQLEVLEEASFRFLQDVIKPAIRKPRGEPRLRELFRCWLQWAEAPYLPGGCPFVAAAVELDDQEGSAREFLVRSQNDWIASLSRAAQIAVEEHHFKKTVAPQQFAFEFHALMLGFHFHHRLLRQRGARELVQAAFERLLNQAKV